MIKLIIIIILVMSILDLGATWYYLKFFNNKFPTIDFKTLEANPILKLAMTHLGLTKGMIVGGIIVFVILLLITLSIADRWLYYLAGVFSMMLIYHLLNISQLAKLNPAG